jgi:hypothetical protein
MKIAMPGFIAFSVYSISIVIVSSCAAPTKKEINTSENSLRIVATDESLELSDSVFAGMSHVIFHNQGTKIHEAMFVKLPDGMTGKNYLDIVAEGHDFPVGGIDYSGPGLTSPGQIVEMWLNLDPGNYILACWFDSHLTSIPIQSLTVHKSKSGTSTPPKEDLTLKLIDFRFELDGSIRKGVQVIKVETMGPSMHEVDFFRLKDGKTINDVKEWQKDIKKGPIPIVALGGVLDNHDISRVIWIKINFDPGLYVLWCYMPMAVSEDGTGSEMTHADAGMFLEIEVTN